MAKDLNGTQTGMNERAGVDDPRPSGIRGKNVFPQSFKHPSTDRYGEWSPFFWAKCERGDVQNLATLHDLHTYTMKSPNGIDVNLRKSFARVNMEAIYPINWERMMTIPTRGDDVPDNCRALLDVRTLVGNLCALLQSGSTSYDTIRAFVLLEHIASNGSLFARFNMHLNYRFNAIYEDSLANSQSFERLSIDKIADYFWSMVCQHSEDGHLCITHEGIQYFVGDSANNGIYGNDVRYVSHHRFVEMCRDNSILSVTANLTELDTITFGFTEFSIYDGYNSTDFSDVDPSYRPTDRFLNIEPIIAYQLVCAQFATNDFVDNVYSAKIYRENLLSLWLDASMSSELPYFMYNGVRTLYDVFSCRYFDELVNFNFAKTSDNSAYYNFWMNIFEYQKALRYGDYFMAAKTRPLAVGEYSALVQSNQVSAIDITRSIQMQRLLNRVNMIGRKLGDYLSGIFGGPIPEAPLDVPIFLLKQDFSIGKDSTTNTGSAQLDSETENLTTTRLVASQDSHSYEVQIERPCYIIGMQTYECVRVYSKTIDRFAFHHDRYDDFIPEQQYIGDQEIYRAELGLESRRTPYSYVLRYMEYKKRYSYASGGFIEYLPSWEFITDNLDGNAASYFFTSNFLRSSPSEFDRFYKSLTNFSLAGYFHFIVFNVNKTAPVRTMEYTPEILK